MLRELQSGSKRKSLRHSWPQLAFVSFFRNRSHSHGYQTLTNNHFCLIFFFRVHLKKTGSTPLILILHRHLSGDGHLAHLTNSAPQGQTHPTGHDPTSGEGLPSQQKKVKQKVRRPCDVCGAKLSSHLSLQRHMECHMGVDRKRFPCEACGAKFTTKESLQHHRRERHTGERPFKCEHCDRSFSHNNYLKLHRKHHTGERFTCEVCGASFLQRQTLTVHVRIHTGENPFSCEECSRKFRRKDSLKSHVIRHHRSERPFNCKVCTRGFVKACKLKEHMRIHTGEAPYACCQCEKRFKRADHLREHMKSRHPVFAANARNGGPWKEPCFSHKTVAREKDCVFLTKWWPVKRTAFPHKRVAHEEDCIFLSLWAYCPVKLHKESLPSFSLETSE